MTKKSKDLNFSYNKMNMKEVIKQIEKLIEKRKSESRLCINGIWLNFDEFKYNKFEPEKGIFHYELYFFKNNEDIADLEMDTNIDTKVICNFLNDVLYEIELPKVLFK